MNSEKVYVSIQLHQATNLIGADIGGLSDPYVIFQIGRQIKKSSRISKTINPVWFPSESFNFTVSASDMDKECLLIELKDWDCISADDPLGSLCISLASIQNTNSAKSYELNLPPELQTSNRLPSYLFLTFSVSSENDHNSTFTDEIWQYERWIPSNGWGSDNLLSSDYGKWSSLDHTKSSINFSDVTTALPDEWDGEGWHFVTDQGDEEGWTYAFTSNGPWHKQSTMLSILRRRKWKNIYHTKMKAMNSSSQQSDNQLEINSSSQQSDNQLETN